MKKIHVYSSSIFIFLILFSCLSLQTQNNNKVIQNNDDYAQLWQKVDSLIQLKLPKSADKIVDTILTRSQNEKNTVHWLKAIKYKVDNMHVLKDEGEKKAIKYTTDIIEKSWSPARSILHVMLAKQYQKYASNRMYKIRNNTNLAELPLDMDEWSLVNFTEKISELYFKGLEDPKLKELRIKDFELLLFSEKYNKEYRKTLYDVLAHETIDYFINFPFQITKPVNEYYLDDPRLFLPAEKFVKTKFQSLDSSNHNFKALKLIQSLMQFHLDRSETKEIFDVDLKRLRWLNSHSTLPNKGTKYFEALKALKERNTNKLIIAEVDLYLVKYYHSLSKSCNQNIKNCTNRWALVKAKKILDDILKNEADENAGWKDILQMSQSMVQDIEHSHFEVSLKSTHIPHENILATFSYRNLGHVNMKLTKIPWDAQMRIVNSNDVQNTYSELVANHKTIQEWTVKLPDPKDYLMHHVDVKIDPLNQGKYILSSKDDQLEQWQHVIIDVSNLASWDHDLGENGKYIIVVDRKSGQPLKDVEVVSYILKNRGRKASMQTIGTSKTDKNGIAYPKLSKNGYASIKLIKGDDIYYSSNPMYRSYRTNPKSYNHTYLFLDRGIYRPGQFIHFKGLAVHFDEHKMPSILKNQKVTVALRDVNYKIVQEFELRTNEFGSFSGQLMAPDDRLLGRMTITSSLGGNASLKVEEYKRPKFYIELEEIEQEYAIGDSLSLQGKAINYSGATLDGAKLQYTILRRAQIPRWCGWDYGYYPYYHIPEKIIARGQLKTNDDGSFEIPVYLEKAINATAYFWFNYKVQISVVDINGERIDHSKSIYAREQGMFLKAQIGNSETTKNLEEIVISAFNLNGKELTSKISYEITSLHHPSKGDLQRKVHRSCDTFIYSKKEYYQYFPNGVYGEDKNPLTWKIKSNINQGSLNSGEHLDLSSLNSGEIYRLTLTAVDHNGNEVNQSYHFEVEDYNGQHQPILADHWMNLNKNKYQIGEEANIKLRFKSNPDYVFRYVARKSNTQGQWAENQWRKNSTKIEEADRGNLFMHWVAVKNNHQYQVTSPILIGWENKDLDISLTTFRDKLKPGDQETWKIKIMANDNLPVQYEYLASMYDQSLDHFVNNKWYLHKLWPTNQLMSRMLHGIGGQVRSFNYYGGYRDVDSYILSSFRKYPILNIYSLAEYWHRGGRMGEIMMDGNDSRILSSAPVAKSRSSQDAEETIENSLKEDEFNEIETKDDVKIRSDLAETVFFYPHLTTELNGEGTISFTMKEALTKWRLQLYAHSSDLKTGLLSKSLVTQKELMVVPSTPRILRVDDEIWVTAKVINMSDDEQNGKVSFQWFETSTDVDITSKLLKGDPSFEFSLDAKKSKVFKWKIRVTDDLGSLIKYKVIALGERHSDGEENTLPILQNKILLTSSKLLQVPRESTKTFHFNRLLEADEHQKHHRLTMQYLSHPVWIAIQALPYLNDPTHKGSDAIAYQLFANALSSQIVKSNPRINEVFDQWKALKSNALLSQLEKNESLKSVLLKETPWVLEGESESAQKKKIALLFDVNTMSQNLNRSIYKLNERQRVDGGFGWFPGAHRSSWHISLNVIENMTMLKSLVTDIKSNEIDVIIKKGIDYLDQEMMDQYQQTLQYVQRNKGKMTDFRINPAMIKYLYIRSFHPKYEIPKKAQEAYNYYLTQMKNYWGKFSFYIQAIAGTTFHQNNMFVERDKIVASINEHSRFKESLGRYWNGNGYHWYQSDVETHTKIMALMRNADTEQKVMDEMRLWLLKNKTANRWKSGSASVSAIYEILQDDETVLEDQSQVVIKVGDELVMSSDNSSIESGTGLIQKSWHSHEISENLGKITITNPSKKTNWGAMYWQFFTPMDQIEEDNKLPISIVKEFYKKEKTTSGDQLIDIKKTTLYPGDEVVVRLKFVVDRELSYLHLKDLRPAGMEPFDFLSGYKWEGGTSYYKTITDEAAHFYFENIRAGTYVLENKMYVLQSGNYSTGPAIIESLYAPEYRSNSNSGRILVSH